VNVSTNHRRARNAGRDREGPFSNIIAQLPVSNNIAELQGLARDNVNLWSTFNFLTFIHRSTLPIVNPPWQHVPFVTNSISKAKFIR